MTRPLAILRLVALAVALIPTDGAHATQHLIRPGDDLGRLAPKLRRGDEVILMPGRHAPADLENVQGTAEQPIVIRGLDAANPSVIDGGRYGLRFLDPRHIRLENLIVTGATIHGLAFTGSRDAEGAPAGGITLRNVQVLETGPTGARHAIVLRQIVGAHIESCVVRGWGGSGLEIIGTADVTVQDVRFEGLPRHTQLSGVRIRGGSENVFIERCHFTDCGDQAVCIGGKSALDELRSTPAEDTAPGTIFEASRVEIARSVIERGRCGVSFVNCERAVVRSCTISAPDRTVVSIRTEQTDPRFGATIRCRFGSNLITWKPDELGSLMHLAGGAEPNGLTVEENLWWTPGFSEVREKLGPFPGLVAFPQIVDVDPRLDDKLLPLAEDARYFGHRSQ